MRPRAVEREMAKRLKPCISSFGSTIVSLFALHSMPFLPSAHLAPLPALFAHFVGTTKSSDFPETTIPDVSPYAFSDRSQALGMGDLRAQ